MHADNRSVDHLDSGVMGSGKCVYDPAPDTSPSPANEAVVACGVRTKRRGQITPGCSGAQDPENPIEDTTVVYPRNATRLVRQHRLDGSPLIIGSSGSGLTAEADINQPTTLAESVEIDPFADLETLGEGLQVHALDLERVQEIH